MHSAVVATAQQNKVVEELVIAPTPSRGSATMAHADSQRASDRTTRVSHWHHPECMNVT